MKFMLRPEPNTQGPSGADSVGLSRGQCRVVVNSAAEIQLNRHRGRFLPQKVNGVWVSVEIPAVGPILANTGLTAATKYYIYSTVLAGVLTLEASTTGHVSDSDTGTEIKSGDPTRTLLAMVHMGAGTPGTFVYSVTQRFLRNWFNREKATTENRFTANRATNSGTSVELNTEIRVELLNWADENIRVDCGGIANGSGTVTMYTRIGEGATPTYVNGGVATTSAVNGHVNTSVQGYVAKPAEGYHFFSLYARTDGGLTGTWLGGTATAEGVNRLRAWVEED